MWHSHAVAELVECTRHSDAPPVALGKPQQLACHRDTATCGDAQSQQRRRIEWMCGREPEREAERLGAPQCAAIRLHPLARNLGGPPRLAVSEKDT